MSNSWWVGQAELDEDQQGVISLPIDESVLILGPPGSGKTNLLLLRANYLYLAGYKNILIVTFTRSLKEYIASGASRYRFPATKIMTCREWQIDLIKQYGGKWVESNNDFQLDREAYKNEIRSVVEKNGIEDVYEAILLDECQDYTSDEIKLFDRLSERLFCVGDERQKIYQGDDSIQTTSNLVSHTVELKYHYRNGVNICKVADGIAKKWKGHRQLSETSNYDEIANPSSVVCEKHDSLNDQIHSVIAKLDSQLGAFPNQLVGVLCPKKTSLATIWDAIQSSKHAGRAFLLHGATSDSFPEGKSIVVTTFHAAKGLEFRALHLVACGELKKFGNNRQMTFTAVTRGKTSLAVYHTDALHSYFESALSSLGPAKTPPNIKDVFGGMP